MAIEPTTGVAEAEAEAATAQERALGLTRSAWNAHDPRVCAVCECTPPAAPAAPPEASPSETGGVDLLTSVQRPPL